MGSPNPSFQKRQKEHKRKEKADEKRAARLAKGKATPAEDEVLEEGVTPPPQDQ